jgi:hypothetical protein
MPGNLAPLQQVPDQPTQQNFDQIYRAWPVGEYVATAIPTGTATGQTTLFQTAAMAALTPPVLWRLWYVDGVGWFPVGGAPLFTETDPYTTAGAPDRALTNGAGYVAVAVAGPVVTLPAPGWYDIELGWAGYNGTAGALISMSYDIGATAASDLDAAHVQVAVVNTDIQRIYRKQRKLFASAAVLTAKYRASGGSGVARGPRFMSATPVLL